MRIEALDCDVACLENGTLLPLHDGDAMRVVLVKMMGYDCEVRGDRINIRKNTAREGKHIKLSRNPNRYSGGTNNTGNMSPVSDGAYSNASASNQVPERPPKEPVAPQLPPKIRTGKLTKPSPLSNEHFNVDDHPYGGSYEQGGSPRSAARKLSGTLGGVPARKPTGPRSMSSASKSGDLNRDDGTVRRNKNRGLSQSPLAAATETDIYGRYFWHHSQ